MDVGVDGERFEVDDAEEELADEDAEFAGQAGEERVGERAEEVMHG